jgi:hypothetical protein
MLKDVPRWRPSWDFQSVQKVTTLQVVSEKKIIKNFSQSEAFMAPGSHVG